MSSAVESRIIGLIGEFARHAQPLRQYVESKIPPQLRSTLTPDDVVQEVWMIAFQRYEHFVPMGDNSLRRWLIGIANRVLWRAIKTATARKRGGDRKRLITNESRSRIHDIVEQASGPLPTPSSEAAAIETAAAVHVAISHLPGQYRKVIEMRYLKGYTHEEIAKRLNKSLAAVNGLLFRGMRKMRKLLGEPEQFFSDVHDMSKGSSSQTDL